MIASTLYPALKDAAPVAAIVGTRIYRDHAGDTPGEPYVVWRLLSALPIHPLGQLPPTDHYTVAIDCFGTTEAQSDALVVACRDAIEAIGRLSSPIQSLGKEAETNLWRYTFAADIFVDR